MEDQQRDNGPPDAPANGLARRLAKYGTQYAHRSARKSYQYCKEAPAKLCGAIGKRWARLTSGLQADRKLELVFTCVIAGSTLLYATVASWQLCVLTEQTKATQTAAAAALASAEVAQRQMELSERPWLSLDARLTIPLSFDAEHGGASLTVQFLLTNVGHSPAANAWIPASVILEGNPIEEQEKLCGPYREKKERWPLGYTIFPGQTMPQPIGLTIEQKDIDAALARGGGFLFPSIIGCVDYGFEFSTGHHQTGFIFHLLVPSDRPGIMLGIKPAPSVPEAQLAWSPIGAGDAN